VFVCVCGQGGGGVSLLLCPAPWLIADAEVARRGTKLNEGGRKEVEEVGYLQAEREREREREIIKAAGVVLGEQRLRWHMSLSLSLSHHHLCSTCREYSRRGLRCYGCELSNCMSGVAPLYERCTLCVARNLFLTCSCSSYVLRV